MRRALTFLFASSMLSVVPCSAQMPRAFSWVDPQSDKITMATVRHALKPGSNTSIRRVGVEDGFAIVMATSQEGGDSERWSIYNLSLATGERRMLVSGYRVKVLDWVGLTSPELAIKYYDCWGCEAATLFTTLHFAKSSGWS